MPWVHATRWTNLLPKFVKVMSRLASLAALMHESSKIDPLTSTPAKSRELEMVMELVMCYQELHRSSKRKLIHIKAREHFTLSCCCKSPWPDAPQRFDFEASLTP